MTKSKRHRPIVVATFAMTADGKVTTRTLAPVDFTSREDKLHLFRQRALADAVLIGHTSLKRDNVRLGLPAELQEARTKRGQSRCPLRVIISNKGRIDDRLKIFQSDISPIIIFSTKRMPPKYRKALESRATLHLSDAEHVDLPIMLATLRNEYNVRRLALRRRTDAFSRLVGRGFNRSTQSHAGAVHVRRSQSANADRSEQGIPAPQRSLLVDRHA